MKYLKYIFWITFSLIVIAPVGYILWVQYNANSGGMGTVVTDIDPRGYTDNWAGGQEYKEMCKAGGAIIIGRGGSSCTDSCRGAPENDEYNPQRICTDDMTLYCDCGKGRCWDDEKKQCVNNPK